MAIQPKEDWVRAHIRIPSNLREDLISIHGMTEEMADREIGILVDSEYADYLKNHPANKKD